MTPTLEEQVESTNGERERRPLKAIALLPSIATLGNLLCGVVAILYGILEMRAAYSPAHATIRHPVLAEFLPSFVACGAYFVALAMIFDALDGRLARIARRTSEFGSQLDSLADIVSCGVAPALLYLVLLLELSDPSGPAPIRNALWRIGVLSGIAYVSCAAIRLARYNAENVRDESTQRRFSGLPAPGAAGAVVSLLILHEHLRFGNWGDTGVQLAAVLRWTIAPIVLGVSLLMVSRLDYVHVFNVYVRREQPLRHLVWLLLALAIAWFSLPTLLVLLAYTYVVSGLLLNVRRRLAGRADGRALARDLGAESPRRS
jgi:CDP-diacylglycerol--serine O-phosphatidyltransferase